MQMDSGFLQALFLPMCGLELLPTALARISCASPLPAVELALVLTVIGKVV